jgi:hypothetical protein
VQALPAILSSSISSSAKQHYRSESNPAPAPRKDSLIGGHQRKASSSVRGAL